ncbi:unnamed protein product [Bursaphelenchus okinawaensis]|uniref:Galectin n=1 Tax=Bursaphelenchus okinawaensis TaxID=465554 RepID=A0A811L2D5_9BILA|nr:unnamed protein product [Bursaphelenchus okinawaensis]CAG9117396.1 unnamed protein product [Bursaphelenchus okinawaensis]
MKAGEKFHLIGNSKTTQKNVVMQLLNNVEGDVETGDPSAVMETPFHVNVCFQTQDGRPEFQYLFAWKRKGGSWDKVIPVPSALRAHQPYHFTIGKTSDGFEFHVNGTFIQKISNPYTSHCTGGIDISSSYVERAWKDNDKGCTVPEAGFDSESDDDSDEEFDWNKYGDEVF